MNERFENPSAADSTRLIEDAFYRRLDELGPSLGLPSDVTSLVRARVNDRTVQAAHLIGNDLDEMNVRFTLLAVALFDIVERVLSRGAAFDVIDDCLNRQLRAAVVRGTREFLDSSPDPFAALVLASKERETHYFGPSFVFERPIDEAHGYVLQVKRCLFHEVLRVCDRRDLQPLLCRFDLNWIDAVDKEKHRVAFVRPSTFATADRCQMWFARTDGDVASRLQVSHGP